MLLNRDRQNYADKHIRHPLMFRHRTYLDKPIKREGRFHPLTKLHYPISSFLEKQSALPAGKCHYRQPVFKESQPEVEVHQIIAAIWKASRMQRQIQQIYETRDCSKPFDQRVSGRQREISVCQSSHQRVFLNRAAAHTLEQSLAPSSSAQIDLDRKCRGKIP